MNSLVYNFNLYVTPNISVPPVLNLSQYDTARTFIAHLKNDNGQPYVLTSGVTATINGKNKKGPFSIGTICKNDTVTFIPSGKATLESGRIYTTMQLVDGEDYLTPLALIFNVQRSAIQEGSGEDDEETPSGSASIIESFSITENGTYTAPSGKAYTPITVNVPQGITPTGTKTINISANGTTTEDVTAYANAKIVVTVPIPQYQTWQGGSY